LHPRHAPRGPRRVAHRAHSPSGKYGSSRRHLEHNGVPLIAHPTHFAGKSVSPRRLQARSSTLDSTGSRARLRPFIARDVRSPYYYAERYNARRHSQRNGSGGRQSPRRAERTVDQPARPRRDGPSLAWRLRYGSEYKALLEDRPITPGLVLDVVMGAVDAHTRPQFQMQRRVRPERQGGS
jgi:hypothetical protein